MRVEVHNSCEDFTSYRAARVKSLFNVESGANFDLAVELPIEDKDWRIGLIVGPSGSGKTSLGRELFGGGAFYEGQWPEGPIIDAIGAGRPFDDVTAALAAVGLGDVPTWLRPYAVLSNGERFRADMARVIIDAPDQVVVDEFTSVVDRQIARMGALAFGKAWRRGSGQAVLLSCHYDIVEWLEPDWVLDTATGVYSGRGLWRRPRFELEVWQTDGSYWPMFEPHHYLKLPRMVAASYYVGAVDGEPVAHVAVSTRPGMVEGRACRLVVMPEWQGAGVGMRFLNGVCDLWRRGENRYSKPMRMLFHTSHPGLCAALRRDRKWTQVSAIMAGTHKGRSRASIAHSEVLNPARTERAQAGYGGHLRGVQGFRYLGERAPA